MIELAKDTCRSWAAALDRRRLSANEAAIMRRLYMDEQRANGVNIRRAMAALDFALFVTAAVHYRDQRSAREKVRDVVAITGRPLSPRGYWDQLDRVHYYVAGVRVGRNGVA